MIMLIRHGIKMRPYQRLWGPRKETFISGTREQKPNFEGNRWGGNRGTSQFHGNKGTGTSHTHITYTWESLKNGMDQYVDEQAVCSAIVHMHQNVFSHTSKISNTGLHLSEYFCES